MNIGFNGQDGHNNHVDFEARAVTIAINIGFNGQDGYNSHVSFDD